MNDMNKNKRFIRILILLFTSLSNPLTHFIGLHQTGVAFNVSRIGHATAEEMTFERCLTEAVNPTRQAHLGTLGSLLLGFGGCGEQIDVAETVVSGTWRSCGL